MDIEYDSDTSERWEDFFGSSTELGPSLLGIYDTLTSTLATINVSNNSSLNNSNNRSNGNLTISRGVNSSSNSSSQSRSRQSSFGSNKRQACGCTLPHDRESSLIDFEVEADNVESNGNSDRDGEGISADTDFSYNLNDGTQQSRVSLAKETHAKPITEIGSRISHQNPSQCQSHSESFNSTGGSSISTHSLCGSREFLANASVSNSNSSLSTGGVGVSSRHRNIRVLSPNVQRIITHSDAVPVDAVDIDALHQQKQQQRQQQLQLNSPEQSPLPHNRYIKKPSHTPACSGHRVKLSQIPLSKVTGKLTQSGNELVQTFDSSTEYLNSLNYSQADCSLKKAVVTSSSTPAVAHIPGFDENTTPTNNVGTPFNFDCILNKLPRKLTLPKYESQESIKLIEMEQLAATTHMLNAVSRKPDAVIQSRTDNGLPTNAKEFIATEPLSSIDMEKVEAINFDLLTEHIEKLTLCDDLDVTSKSTDTSYTSEELIEAINKPLTSKPLVRSSSAASASTVTGLPLLTYARAKCLAAAKSKTLGGAVPTKLPTAEQLAELEEANKFSAENLDRLTDIKSKFSPKETRKLSGPMLPEIAKLKHRPLSSSSICSTSSSSSSGSDQLNGKLATSYLASVESLAESENEISSLSVFERACLEIIDSERSYVEDLRQVIRGYLQDWKERACLRYDELKILFSNIEEICEFNSTLLKQLINSGMDPSKIANCFIELRERFDVYTTYCTSYPEAISLLTKLLQATHTNALLASTQKMLQHTLPLGSYLLKPVQRILKYHLLLDNLRKHCDVKEVLQAYEIMRQVARNIDQVKRKLEQQSRVKELSGILDGWLGPELTVLGELRQEGLLMEHNKPRLVFLFATMLIITKQKEDGRLQFKSYIHQNNLMLSEHLPGEPTSFYVIPYDEPRNQIKLTAKNRDLKRFWAQHIKGVILEKFDNIPKRAKELVYQLGDEEDRTPDRSTWKWGLHTSSNSTPVYLERRNQCRRSEIRSRSKFKRKTVTNSSSFDSFNEAVVQIAKEQGNIPSKPAKPLTNNNSMDDNMLPALQKFAAAVRSRSISSKRESTSTTATAAKFSKSLNSGGKKTNGTVTATDCKCQVEEQYCLCILRDQRARSVASEKSSVFSYKTLKERSKSVPRIGYGMDDLNEEDDESVQLDSKTYLVEQKSKGKAGLEVKQHNYKTIPKRIATLKKQRVVKKGTSKFYMDLSEFDCNTTTELKITESSENLLVTHKQQNEAAQSNGDKCERQLPDVVDQYYTAKTAHKQLNYETLSPAEKTKHDAKIIFDILKNNKEFDRICNKQHNRRDGNSICPQSPLSPRQEGPPPRPPSKSPPPLESEQENVTVKNAQEVIEDEEPIYESLLRNVHVPYKFSPVLCRADFTQYYKPREKKPHPPAHRPESDYVTLIYSPEGRLQKVGKDMIAQKRPQIYDEIRRDSSDSTSSSSSTVKRGSQNSAVHIDCDSQGNISQASSTNTNATIEPLYARPIPKNLMKRLLNSSTNGTKSSLENVSNSETSLLPRALKSIDNKTLAFGRMNRPPERRISDVVEMCRQSILHRQGSEAVGERMAHVDYADPRTLFNVVGNFDVSLQRDSVFSLTSSNDSVCDQQRKLSAAGLPSNFEYELDVEDCLENDFRDSAIYSDDNEKRAESDLKRPNSSPPSPPPARYHPQVMSRPSTLSASVTLPANASTLTAAIKEKEASSTVMICSPHLDQTASRSWVLQQIENFSK